MGEGLIYRSVDNDDLDAELRSLAVNYLLANGDTDIKILSTQLEYSNYRGYSYQVIFENNGCEEGMLEIRYNDNEPPTIKEI
jgi:hypothetical protein